MSTAEGFWANTTKSYAVFYAIGQSTYVPFVLRHHSQLDTLNDLAKSDTYLAWTFLLFYIELNNLNA